MTKFYFDYIFYANRLSTSVKVFILLVICVIDKYKIILRILRNNQYMINQQSTQSIFLKKISTKDIITPNSSDYHFFWTTKLQNLSTTWHRIYIKHKIWRNSCFLPHHRRKSYEIPDFFYKRDKIPTKNSNLHKFGLAVSVFIQRPWNFYYF